MKFAGNFTINGDKKIDLDFDFIVSLNKNNTKNVFIFGETNKNKEEFLAYLREKFGELSSIDISFSTEDKLEIIGESYEEGIYEVATFEGAEIDFKEIFQRFAEFDEVVCVREAETSEKFGNKKIKVDFVY